MSYILNLNNLQQSLIKVTLNNNSIKNQPQAQPRVTKMSIYSGLPTRQAQSSYNKLLSRLLLTLQQHLLSLLSLAPSQPPSMPESYSQRYVRILAKMQQYQEHKYLPPKFSQLMEPLSRAIREGYGRAGEKAKRDTGIGFNLKLQAVKEQQQMPSNRQIKKHKTELYMKKSAALNKRIIQKQQLLSQSYSSSSYNYNSNYAIKNSSHNKKGQKQKQKQRSYSVFSQKKPKLQSQTQFKRTQKLNPRQGFNQNQTSNSFMKKRQIATSSGSRYRNSHGSSNSNGNSNLFKNKHMLTQTDQKQRQTHLFNSNSKQKQKPNHHKKNKEQRLQPIIKHQHQHAHEQGVNLMKALSQAATKRNQ